MTFVKGQSGNPGGRPAAVLEDGRKVADVARGHTIEAIDTLAMIMRDDKQAGAARVSAASAILDRAWGRPKQDLGIEMKSDEATASLLEQARRRAAGAS